MYFIVCRKVLLTLDRDDYCFLVLVLLSSLVVIVSLTLIAYNQVVLASPQSSQGPDITLLSQRYNEDSLVGEVTNNGTAIAEFVKVSASFYDDNGNIVGREFTFADPHTLNPGDRSPFEMFISSDAIKQEATTYEFILQWQDETGKENSKRVLAAEANQPGVEGNGNTNERDNEDNEDDGNDGNDGNNDNNNDGPLEELGNMLGF
jgi:hypothetical protein